MRLSPYVSTLSQSAINYLTSEGLTMDTIIANQIGEALSFGYEIRRMLDDPKIERGVSTKTKAKLKEYPLFSNRATYPLVSVDGEILGHSGRALNWKKSDPFPKYLNSPTTTKFKKSEFLYGEHYIIQALKSIDVSKAKVWLFEGQKDALLAQQLGLLAVAPLGKITPQQLAKIASWGVKHIVSSGDNDLSGRKFNLLCGELAEQNMIRAEVATLPTNYNDLGDGKGKIKLEEFTIKPFFDWVLDSISNLKPFTRLNFFNTKLQSLLWEHADISVIKKHPWLENATYSRIMNKYYYTAHRAITGDTIYLSGREKEELEQDNFLSYILNDMDYIVDDEINQITYYHNKRELTPLEEQKYLWLVDLHTNNTTPIEYPTVK